MVREEPVVYDFNSVQDNFNDRVCTYITAECENEFHDAEHPLMILHDPEHLLKHHQNGDFLNPNRRTAFEFKLDEDQAKGGSLFRTVDIIWIDSRFIKLLEWLGGDRRQVRLYGSVTKKGYSVYRIRAVDPTGMTNIKTGEDSFLQLVISRLLASKPYDLEEEDEIEDEKGKLTDLLEMENYLFCAGSAIPRNVRVWAQKNLAVTKSNSVSPEERRHAQRALSLMLNMQWKGTYFEAIDPIEARRILDEELYGMESVKQRIIETVIQINRTHTLPAYGILLAGPAGIGKSQVAYAVARILKLPWISLDMSAIHDAEALTGSPRVYANAKPGRIMEGFAEAGSSNLVFIINELDKADVTSPNGNPADALLTLLDNLGFTDNYIECTIPTDGVYPVATANDKHLISDPLMSRFCVIDIPDYTQEEKKRIFTDFSMPKILKRMGMNQDEITVTDEALQVIIHAYRNESGVRDLEQAAEHLAAHALYRIETEGIQSVTYDADSVRELL